MEAKDMLVTNLIGKKNSIFYVPLYQRKYTCDAKKNSTTMKWFIIF